MNYILSFVYLFASLIFSYGLGRFILQKIHSKHVYFSKIIVSGYLYLFAIQWFVGFPSQVLHASWQIYYTMLSIVYLLHVLLLLYYWRKQIMHSKPFHMVKKHFAQYWFIYILVITFSFMSMTSQFSYFQHSYDDYFYLGSTVQEMGVSSLANIDFYTGMPMQSDIIRLLNTFSLQYGFMAQTFHIDPVAFMRFAAVIQNYIIVFMAYHALLSQIEKKEDGVQYHLALITIFLVPSAYLVTNNYISTYDDWQFNNAIWYGSSIVRLIGLPVLLMFGKACAERLNWRNIIWIGLLCVAFISLSTIAIPFIILSIIIMFLYWLYRLLKQTYPLRCNWYFGLTLAFIFIIFVVILPEFLYNSNAALYEKMHNEVLSFEEKINKYATVSLIVRFMLPILLIGAYTLKNKTLKWYTLCVTCLSIVVFGGLGSYFMIIISVFYDFVALRFSTGIQMMIFVLCSYILMHIIKEYQRKLVPIIPCVLVAFFCFFNYRHLDVYKTLTFHTSGLSEYGFSVKRLLTSDQMMPDVVTEIGAFFDSFEEKKRVIVPYELACEDGVLRFYDSIVYSSPNASVLTRSGDTFVEGDDIDDGVGRSQLISFIENNEECEDIDALLQRYNIDFIFTTDPDMNDTYGWNVYQSITYEAGKTLYILEV